MKPKLIVYMVPKTVLSLILPPKNSLKDPNRAKKTKTKIDSLYYQVQKIILSLTPIPKIAPKSLKNSSNGVIKGKKKEKGSPKCSRIKDKKIDLYFRNRS